MSAGAAGGGPATYRAAGVDIDAGDEAVERIKGIVASTARPEVLGGIGGFGGAFAFDAARYGHPVLVSSTDGVGTKAMVAAAAGRYDTIGIDLVAMCADDVVCTGAEPLFLLDYVATGRLDPAQMEQLVSGVAHGCRRAGCALLGGEMAEHAGATAPGEFDLAGFVVGVVERSEMLGAERVRAGDVLLGLVSPGLRCNGYTLARHVLLERAGLALSGPAWPGAAHSLADELLAPSVIYSPAVLSALRTVGVTGLHAVAHVTGGGIPGNLSRVLPRGLDAEVRVGSWEEPAVFGEIRRLGAVVEEEMQRVFNLGLGMVLVAAPDAVADVTAATAAAGCAAVPVGSVVQGHGAVRMVPA
ncbi:MAG: phosphoribosylformylglycinamidine cyclo-ligase [Acidimicrobiales bacterium]